MNDDCEPESVEEVLDCVEQAGEGEERVSVSDIVRRIGDGAFAPLMLMTALVMISPATAIFGVATACGIVIALIAVQMTAGRKTLWLPGFILDRTISTRHLDKTVSFLSKPARFVDGLTQPRLSCLVEKPLDRAWAALCLLLALFIPILELVPMSATIIATAIALFGLALVARDGLVALFGVLVLGCAGWLAVSVAT